MSAGGAGAIGPVSVRYAAQIRELLFGQAMQRMAAEQEAARAQADADRTARAEAATKAEQVSQPLHARIDVKTAPSEASAEPTSAPAVEPARIVDIQA